MKLTSKGQVTIPLAIRKQAGLEPGDEVEFTFEDGDIKLARGKHTKTRGERIVERLRGRATLGMTTDEIMALTRGEE